MRIVDVQVHRGYRFRGEQDPEIMCGVDVVKSMQGRFHVTGSRLVSVRSKEGVNGEKVRTSQMGEPTNTPDEALLGFLLAFKGRTVIIFRRRSHRIYRNPGAIRCRSRSLISVRGMKTLNQIGSKTGLIEVDSDGRRGNPPGKVHPKKPVHNPHEITLTPFWEEPTE
jgi:hypothetical protein